MAGTSIRKISVIVPRNPFAKKSLENVEHCLTALDVENLMHWWPGRPHTPHRDAKKVRDIQRSLDWKRVARIAAYLLQDEIVDAPDLLDKYFREIYEPAKYEPGREWPPRVTRVIGFERSEYPTFSNVLLHVNGATVTPLNDSAIEGSPHEKAAKLVFDENNAQLRFSVIDGQHRINGAYFALKIRQQSKADERWEIPSEIFLNLDPIGQPPRHQAQIFIDVNFNQKKVDRSLVADLFPTARGPRGPLDDKERAQDIGRRLMLEEGPLVGIIQIPGIRYGVQDVVTLATLNSAIEPVLERLRAVGLDSLDDQTEFLAQCLNAWLEGSGRKHDFGESDHLDSDNVAYQGRILVSVLDLAPAAVFVIRQKKKRLVSALAEEVLRKWFHELLGRAGLLKNDRFIPKGDFKVKGFLGSGGIGRLRDTLWAAAVGNKRVSGLSAEKRAALAGKNKEVIFTEISAS